MAVLKQNTAYTRMFMLVQSADHLTALTGATPSVSLSKAGGTFAAAGGTITEVANGWYKIALTTTDTNTVGDLAYHITATSADPTDFVDQVSPTIINDLAPPTNFSSMGIDASGNVALQSNTKKNNTWNNFEFVMTDSTTHLPKTGLTVTATRSIDGAAFSATTNSPTEIANGTYTINLPPGDTNGNRITYRFTATGADDLNIMVITTP